ncbi:MAG: hypothetical protein AAF485_02815 [Chloroflexota bacterium]
MTLTVGDAYYLPNISSSTFPVGVTVYAFVDSINHSTSYGNVQESDEGNNVFGAVTSTVDEGLPSLPIITPASREGLPLRK